MPMKLTRTVGIMVAALVLAASTIPTFAGDAPATTLRKAAAEKGIWVGAAVSHTPLVKDPAYSATLAREFNLLTTENELKMSRIRPSRTGYDFAKPDEMVAFAEANGMAVRGHTLVWHEMQPKWITETKWTKEELTAILKDHITTTVSRYKGRIRHWDVVNEALENNGTMRRSFWYDTIGPEYIELAFRWAHEADPDAILFYNDYGTEGSGAKSDAAYRLVKGLKEKGVPIHGVGWQMHIDAENYPSTTSLLKNAARIRDLGLELHITELDVKIQNTKGTMEARLAKQARVYATMMDVTLRAGIKAFITWGFTDRHTWIPGFTKKEDWPLPFDADYRAKPSYTAILDKLTATK